MQLQLPFFEKIASSQEIKKSTVKSKGTPNQWKKVKLFFLYHKLFKKYHSQFKTFFSAKELDRDK